MAFPPFKRTQILESFSGAMNGGFAATPTRLYVGSVSGRTKTVHAYDRTSEAETMPLLSGETFDVQPNSVGNFIRGLAFAADQLFILEERSGSVEGRVLVFKTDGTYVSHFDVLHSSAGLTSEDPDAFILNQIQDVSVAQIVMDGRTSQDNNVVRPYRLSTGVEVNARVTLNVSDIEHACITEDGDIFAGRKSRNAFYGYDSSWARASANDYTLGSADEDPFISSRFQGVTADGNDVIVYNLHNIWIYGEPDPEPAAPIIGHRQLHAKSRFSGRYHIVTRDTQGTLTAKALNVRGIFTNASEFVDVGSSVSIQQQLSKFRFVPEVTLPEVARGDWIFPAMTPEIPAALPDVDRWQIRGFEQTGNLTRQEIFAEEQTIT